MAMNQGKAYRMHEGGNVVRVVPLLTVVAGYEVTASGQSV